MYIIRTTFIKKVLLFKSKLREKTIKTQAQLKKLIKIAIHASI